ncbi:MAG TPA: TolC family outer membrane protein [Noviherbaspirillum sp.]|nr:TolC family outer membrane protein [Noviherbaspirillum sp.]
MNKRQWLAGVLLLPLCATAQVESFKETAQRALLSNPEVQARLHVWQAAKEERAAAAGGYLPRADVSSSVGRENRHDPLLQGSYNQNLATLTLTQMLYDGFATRSDVQRLDHAALVRFFELRDISESTALEVVRAYDDVLRYRELVAFAEENYVQHRALFEQVQRKAQAGVARRVDLETASGRLALAESNLLTESANLHDVTARFQRLTGTLPGKELGPIPDLSRRMPGNAGSAVAAAVERNPALMAALENVRANRSAAGIRKSSYQPRIDFQARSAFGQNVGGNIGSQSNHSAGLVLSWNLFNGGSDLARSRQVAQQINSAQDLFDKACRDLRQTLAIAYNDTRKLAEQIDYLDQHQLATEKSRDAYRKQFDIGQRTLLDLLDTENELFQARRAYTNASHDLTTAYARVAAATGTLVASLGLTEQGADVLPDIGDQDAQDAAGRCRAEAPAAYAVDKEALNRRASELSRENAPAAAPVTPAPAAPAAPDQGMQRDEVLRAIDEWAKAWGRQDVGAYLNAYGSDFQVPGGATRKAWERKRRRLITNKRHIEVRVEAPQVTFNAGTAVVKLTQIYVADRLKETTNKTLVMARQGGTWKIIQELAGD